MHMKSGFIEGFSDYLHRGGSGLAPIAPPRRYWEPSTSTNRQNAISQWKSGFEQGSQIARESGLRELIVIPFDDGVLAASHHGHYGDAGNTENTPLVADASFYQVHGSEVQSSHVHGNQVHLETTHGQQVLSDPVQNNQVQDKQVQSSPVQSSPVQHNLALDKPAHNSAVQHLPVADSSIENESEFVDEENFFYDLPSSPKAKEASVVPGFYEKFDKTDEMPTSAKVFKNDDKDKYKKNASILGIDTVGSIPFPRESLAGNDPLFP